MTHQSSIIIQQSSVIKAMVAPTEKMEELMSAVARQMAGEHIVEKVSKDQVITTMKETAPLYKQMVELYNELVLQVKAVNRGVDGVKGLKALTL